MTWLDFKYVLCTNPCVTVLRQNEGKESGIAESGGNLAKEKLTKNEIVCFSSSITVDTAVVYVVYVFRR